MARYIVVHRAPFTRQELVARAKAFPGYAPKDVHWKCSYCDFAGDIHFCEWEAPDEKVLRRVMDLTQASFEAIHPVERLDVAKGQFEE